MVIAIIGVLASVVLASLNASRVKARNASVLAQMDEYVKALDLFYANTGRYPSAHSNNNAAFRNRLWCIGEPHDLSRCLAFSRNGNVNSEVETALMPTYISTIVHIDQGTDSRGVPISSPVYQGCSKLQNNTVVEPASSDPACSDGSYSIYFALEGTNQNCGSAHTVTGNYQAYGYTVCQITRSD